MKYLLIFPALIVLIIGMIFYSTWAWSQVFDWYLVNYLSTYFSWAQNVSLKAIQAAFLFAGAVYAVWFGSKHLSDSSTTKSTEDSIITTTVALIIVAAFLPWIIKFFLWLQVSWFNL